MIVIFLISSILGFGTGLLAARIIARRWNHRSAGPTEQPESPEGGRSGTADHVDFEKGGEESGVRIEVVPGAGPPATESVSAAAIAAAATEKRISAAAEIVALWYWSMPYIRKLLSLVTGKTEAAALGLIEKYTEVQGTAGLAGEEARAARTTLETAGDGVGVDALVETTRRRISEERQRAQELESLGDRTREQTRESDQLIKRVSTIVEEIGDIADRSKVISINLGIEAAKIGRAGAPFKVIAQQLRTLNTSTADASRRARSIMDDFSAFQLRLVETWQQAILENINSAGESAHVTEQTIESLVGAIESIREVFDRLIERTIASESSMAEILEHLQFQDITRQQVENVDEIIQDLVEQTRLRRDALLEDRLDIDDRNPELIAALEEKMRKRFKVFDETTVLEDGFL